MSDVQKTEAIRQVKEMLAKQEELAKAAAMHAMDEGVSGRQNSRQENKDVTRNESARKI